MPDGRYIGTALSDALAKVVAIGVQQSRPTAAWRPFGVLARPQEVAHCPLVQVCGPPDRLERQALGSEPHHFLVACQSRCASINAQLLPGHQRQRCIGPGGLRLRQRAHNHQLSSLAQSGIVTLQQPLNRLAQIGQEMPAIGNLLGVRNHPLHGVRVRPCTVAGYHPDRRMALQPVGHAQHELWTRLARTVDFNSRRVRLTTQLQTPCTRLTR